MICDRGGQGAAGRPHGANRSGDEVLMVTVVCWVWARGSSVGRHQRPRPESSAARPYGGPSGKHIVLSFEITFSRFRCILL